MRSAFQIGGDRWEKSSLFFGRNPDVHRYCDFSSPARVFCSVKKEGAVVILCNPDHPLNPQRTGRCPRPDLDVVSWCDKLKLKLEAKDCAVKTVVRLPNDMPAEDRANGARGFKE